MMEPGKSYGTNKKVACVFHFLVINRKYMEIPTNKIISFGHLISPKGSCLEALDLLYLLTVSLPAHPKTYRIILVDRKIINRLTRMKKQIISFILKPTDFLPGQQNNLVAQFCPHDIAPAALGSLKALYLPFSQSPLDLLSVIFKTMRGFFTQFLLHHVTISSLSFKKLQPFDRQCKPSLSQNIT